MNDVCFGTFGSLMLIHYSSLRLPHESPGRRFQSSSSPMFKSAPRSIQSWLDAFTAEARSLQMRRLTAEARSLQMRRLTAEEARGRARGGDVLRSGNWPLAVTEAAESARSARNWRRPRPRGPLAPADERPFAVGWAAEAVSLAVPMDARPI